MNASFGGQSARFDLRTPQVLLLDPLALDGLRDELIELATLAPDQQRERIRALGTQGLRLGFQDVPAFEPGSYELDVYAFEAVDADAADLGVFQTDSGTVVVIDVGALEPVARVLTWDRYDALLQTPLGDDSALEALNREVGGPCFAIVSADASVPFSGDGAFRLRPDRLRRVG